MGKGVVVIMNLLPLGGVLLMAGSLIFAFARRKSVDDRRQYHYILKGVILVVFAVGAFSVGSWLVSTIFAEQPDSANTTLNGWIFAVPLLLVVLFGLSLGAKRTARNIYCLDKKVVIRQMIMKK
jgi:polyferredoxin